MIDFRRSFRAWLEDRLRIPAREQLNSPLNEARIQRVIIVGKFPNPTYEYYFAARLAARGMPRYETIDFRDFNEASIEPAGVFLIFVRYSTKPIIKWVNANRSKLAGVGVFWDDDISAVILGQDATARYRYRLYRDAVAPFKCLKTALDKVWVSTPQLAQQLSHLRPRVLPPAPSDEIIRPRPNHNKVTNVAGHILIAYHATDVHVQEHAFLFDVIKVVLDARPNVSFEVYAGKTTRSLWCSLNSSRVFIKEHVSWPAYLEANSGRFIDIMLVPLAPHRANASRSSTKRIDVARVHAAGLFSDCAAYEEKGKDEILVPFVRSTWINSLLALIDQPKLRVSAASATRKRVEEMIELGGLGLEIK
ncbi:hypothetical protein ACFFP0_30585 [Rhizobium puerariae]|uniref:Glycosyltransferase family 1 protein n=1 Tax=Rhizobium puerariae TaxID=1585791 RepID=A0ABV6ARG6_9HYPH